MTDVRAYLRVSGAGNDFLALTDGRGEPPPQLIRAWCRRGVSLGADGVFTLEQVEAGRVRMRHFNADGGLAELCVNGTRCAARLAFDLGWAPDGEVDIETGAGLARAMDRGSSIQLEVPPPTASPLPLDLSDLIGSRLAAQLRVGVPHVVVEWDETLAEAPVAVLGAAIRFDPRVGAAGANVNFVRFPSPDRLEIRTFERGVEAETLACGSGILAATAVGWQRGRLGPQLTVASAGGFPFAVEGRLSASGLVANWSLSGDARVIARGEILPGAAAEADAPAWTPAGEGRS